MSKARRGDVFACENGHPMCEAVDDIEVGDFPWAHKLGRWAIDPPRQGDPWPVCGRCGARLSLERPLEFMGA